MDINKKNMKLFGKKETKSYIYSDSTLKILKDIFTWANTTIGFTNPEFNELLRYYSTNSVVYGLIATQIGRAMEELSEVVEMVDKDNKPVNHWAKDLLQNPNDLENFRRFIKAWTMFRLVCGNAMINTSWTLGSKPRITEMIILPIQEITIHSESNRPYSSVAINGGSNKVPFSEIIFSKEPNYDPTKLWGLSPLKAAAYECQLLENGLIRQNTSILNGGVGRVVTPKMTELGIITQEEREKAEFAFNDIKNANKTKFVPTPLDVLTMGNTSVDLEILSTSKYAITALSYVFGVPIDVFSGESKYDNAKEVKKTVYFNAAIPLMSEFLADYATHIKRIDADFRNKGYKFIINTDKIAILQGSMMESINTYKAAGTSINERRELLGLPKRLEKWADEIETPLGVSYGDPTMSDIQEV